MEIEELLSKAKRIENLLERKLFFTAILTEKLKDENSKPIIVGGTAVEFYTLGGYSTFDLDLVYKEKEKIDKIFKEFGFKRYGRHWYNEELDLAVEIPSSTLIGSENRLTKIKIEGLTAYMIGIEDIIADRLNAYVHWKSEDDCEWARRMMILHRDKIDWNYLKERSKKDKTYAALKKLKKEVKEYGSGI
jgi:predicted nucleotidyltransferase